MTKLIKIAVWTVFIAFVLVLVFGYIQAKYLPDSVRTYENESFQYGQGLLTVRQKETGTKEAAAETASSYNGVLYLFDMIPIKNVRVNTVDEIYVVPGGMPFGIKMFTAGVVVVGTADVYTLGGAKNPAKEANIKEGDIIVTVDGIYVKSNEDIMAIVSSSEGRPLDVTYIRNGENLTTRLTPVNAKNGTGFKAGMWVRDSSAGIGTITYINEKTGMVAGLGHGVTDSDTGVVLPVSSGELVKVNITGVDKGKSGDPGELKGIFDTGGSFASLLFNCECGIYAKKTADFYFGTHIAAALRQEVKPGSAKILCTIDGKQPQYYDAEIESVNLSDENPTKNLVIRITDKKLIESTGGIVQGMSGSPIVQNGKIVGAITHVFVNEPTKGYGIFIENMLYSEQLVVNSQNNSEAA